MTRINLNIWRFRSSASVHQFVIKLLHEGAASRASENPFSGLHGISCLDIEFRDIREGLVNDRH